MEFSKSSHNWIIEFETLILALIKAISIYRHTQIYIYINGIYINIVHTIRPNKKNKENECGIICRHEWRNNWNESANIKHREIQREITTKVRQPIRSGRIIYLEKKELLKLNGSENKKHSVRVGFQCFCFLLKVLTQLRLALNYYQFFLFCKHFILNCVHFFCYWANMAIFSFFKLVPTGFFIEISRLSIWFFFSFYICFWMRQSVEWKTH